MAELHQIADAFRIAAPYAVRALQSHIELAEGRLQSALAYRECLPLSATLQRVAYANRRVASARKSVDGLKRLMTEIKEARRVG